MEPFQLTAAGRPVLLEDEVEVCAVANVTINQPFTMQPAGAPFILRLTNVRFLLQSTLAASAAPIHYQLRLDKVVQLDAPHSTFLWTHTKLGLHFTSSATDPTARQFIEVNMKENRDFFIGKLKEQLEKKSWVHKARFKVWLAW